MELAREIYERMRTVRKSDAERHHREVHAEMKGTKASASLITR